MISNQDKHLNLFHFFSDNNNPYYEDNLTRGLAICLQNDPVFAERFFRMLFKDQFNEILSFDGNDDQISINIQVDASSIKGVKNLLGVALTTDDHDLSEYAKPRKRSRHYIDMVIQINDTMAIVEVKRTDENCMAQLRGQMGAVLQANEDAEIKEEYKSYKWKSISKLLEEVIVFQRNIGTVNTFTKNYTEFLYRKHPGWFETKPFRRIIFPEKLSYKKGTAGYEIQRRIDLIKNEMYGEEELRYDRGAKILDNIDWADELNFKAKKIDGKDYIAIELWPGDTKDQGWKIYKKDQNITWPEKVAGYETHIIYNIKFAHFNKGIHWVSSSDVKNPITHNYPFFKQNAGRWKKTEDGKAWEKRGAEWESFKNGVNELKSDWTNDPEWISRFQSEGRNYFDVSIGYGVHLLVPYKEARKLDHKNTKAGKSKFAEHLKSVADKFINEIDKFVKT